MASGTAEGVARAYYLRQAMLGRRVADRVQALWWALDPSDLTDSWNTTVGPAVLRTVSAGQLAAAAPADAYVRAVEAAVDAQPDPGGTLRPTAFAGLAADGRALDSLLYLPVITTKQGLAAGLATQEAMMSGLAQLLTMATSEVADAGRSAAGVSIAADRTVTGYVRVLSPPSCARCVVLAGREYGWNKGFQRHPHCDCVHMPVTRYQRNNPLMDPGDYFRSLSRAEQDRVFTAAGARAIRDGSDIGQVVNARRSMYAIGTTPGGQRLLATREGMTRRGLAYKRLKQLEAAGRAPARGRLVPEAIYRLASDRDEAIRLLHRYGYLY
jgi:hypothetical protein